MLNIMPALRQSGQAPLSLTYRGTVTLTYAASTDNDAFSFPAGFLGPATSRRCVALCFNRTTIFVSLAGATEVAWKYSDQSDAVSGNVVVLKSPTGDTNALTIELGNTYTGTMEVAVYTFDYTGLPRCVASSFNTQIVTGGATSLQSVEPALPGAVTIACVGLGGAGVSVAWTNATEDNELNSGGGRLSTASVKTGQVFAGSRSVVATFGSSQIAALAVLQVIPEDAPFLAQLPVTADFINFSAQTSNTAVAPLRTYDALNEKVIVALAMELNASPIAVTYAGVAMTLVSATINTTPTPDLRTFIYMVDVVPNSIPDGLNNLQVTFLASTTGKVFFEAFVTANIFAPLDVASVSSNATSVTGQLDVEQDGDFVLAVCARTVTTSSPVFSGSANAALNLVTDMAGSGWQASTGVARGAPAGANLGVTATWGSSTQNAMLAVSFERV